MIGVGIDVAKVKSMVAILSDDGEIIKAPFFTKCVKNYTKLNEIVDIVNEIVYNNTKR